MFCFVFYIYCVLIRPDISHVLIYVPYGVCGLTDHISIMMVFASSCALKSSKPTQKTITVWPTGAEAVLKDCFESTDGPVDLVECTSAITGYNRKYIQDVQSHHCPP